MTLYRMGKICRKLKQDNRAVNHYSEALKIYHSQQDAQDEAIMCNNLAVVHGALGQKEEAQNYYDKAKSIIEHLQDSKSKGMILNNVGLFYLGQGKDKEALGCFQSAVQCPNCTEIQSNIEELREKVGQEQFQAWLAKDGTQGDQESVKKVLT